MADKTLSEIAIDARKNFKGNNYSNNVDEMYSAEHEDAKTHDDEQHPLGKGTPGKGDARGYRVYTEDGGGSYDKFGRIGAGEGRKSMRLNSYTKEYSYAENHPEVDESIKGQFVTKNRF